MRVKTARRRTASSAAWLERQLNDPYVAEAQRLGLRSRAAFKLLQLDRRFHLLKPGKRVVDLGSAPGGWLQVVVDRVRANGSIGGSIGGSTGGSIGGRAVGIDYLGMEAIPGAAILMLDFLDPAAPDRLKALLGGPADLVLSDMAAPATGHAPTDHLRVMALADAAYAFAAEVLSQGGGFVAKVFQGGTERGLLDRLKQDFVSVRHAKPPASRAESAEVYVVAQGFRALR